MNNKSFSIIIPAYNSTKFIEKNLFSIINQEYDKKLIEIIVVDDGSKDNLKDFIDKFKGNYPDHNINYYCKSNGNWGSVINYVIDNKLAKNDLISILDSDDVYLPSCLKEINNKILDNDIFVISFSYWNGDSKVWKRNYPYLNLLNKKINKNKFTPYCGPLTYFYKKELFYKLKPLKENISYQDSILLIQLLQLTNKIIFTRKILALYYYRRENSSTSLEWNEKRFNAEFNTCREIIDLGCQEIVAYRLCVRKFRQMMEKYNKKFVFERKNKFLFFPFYMRWIFHIYFFFFLKKYTS